MRKHARPRRVDDIQVVTWQSFKIAASRNQSSTHYEQHEQRGPPRLTGRQLDDQTARPHPSMDTLSDPLIRVRSGMWLP
jgi:hypothetical protein